LLTTLKATVCSSHFIEYIILDLFRNVITAQLRHICEDSLKLLYTAVHTLSKWK